MTAARAMASLARNSSYRLLRLETACLSRRGRVAAKAALHLFIAQEATERLIHALRNATGLTICDINLFQIRIEAETTFIPSSFTLIHVRLPHFP